MTKNNEENINFGNETRARIQMIQNFGTSTPGHSIQTQPFSFAVFGLPIFGRKSPRTHLSIAVSNEFYDPPLLK